jgi:choline dehydrogenase
MLYPEELWLPFQRTFVQACREIGFRSVPDFNAPDAWDGVVGPWPRNRRNEIRQGSLVTYIRKARARPNLEIRGRALVDRVLVRDGRASGVTYLDGSGARHELLADRVVVCAGAYGTPSILLRTGIGPADELRALGIDVLADLPVGRGLLEHPGLRVTLRVGEPQARGGWPGLAVASRGAGYWAIPGVLDQERRLAWLGFFLGLVDGPGGSVRLRSIDPDAAPAIDHGFAALAESDAFAVVWADVERLLASDALAGAVDVDRDVPQRERQRRGISTGTHPAGGCAIGRVVDPRLGVYGIEGLTVADASVFPRHVTNNPNLTCHMVGEQAAAFLR